MGFTDSKAEYYLSQANLTKNSPIFFSTVDNCFGNLLKEIIVSIDIQNGKELVLTGLLNTFLGKLIVANISSQPEM